MQSALVIGANGFVGKRIVAVLAAQGVKVLGVSRTGQSSGAIPTCSTETILRSPDHFDAVFLLAAVIPYQELERVTPALVASNILLPAQIVERFCDTRLVYASSVSVYGTPCELPVTEEHPFVQPNAYGLSKAMGERMVAAHDDAVSLRFSSIYGAGMTAPSFIPRLISQGRSAGRLTVFGDGSRRQDYLHVDDAVSMLLAAGASHQCGILNAVSGASASNRDVATLVAERMGDLPIDFTGTDLSPSYEYSSARWNDAFSTRPQVTLQSGIARMLEET